jgi:acyl-CoA dehydrogenase
VRSIVAREKQGGAEHQVARDTVAILGRSGLTELFSDPKRVDLRGICVAREALAWASGSADSLFAVQGLGTYPIAAWGNDAQRAAYLPKLRAGEHVGAFGLTEPEAGTDVASLKTVAVREGDSWRLTGRKTFISNAPVADHVVLFANADPERGR